MMLAPLLALMTGAFPVETLRYNGDSSNRIDLVILGDGYRAQDQAQLSADANELVEALFTLRPFQDFERLFNVKLVKVVSRETGADQGSFGAERDTALGSSYFCGNIERALCADNTLALSVAAEEVPEYDLIIVLVNDPKYGGSGGVVATVSTAPSSSEIVRHELGHTLGRLGDEYTTGGYGALCTMPDCIEPNITRVSSREGLKWRAWVEPSTPVPTPAGHNFDGIGVFEGARYRSRNIYRPKDTACLMKLLGQPFCSVCAEGLVRGIFNRLAPIEYSAPEAGPTLHACEQATFTAAGISDVAWSYEWSVDGRPVAGDTPSLTVDSNRLATGSHAVAVRVFLSTPLVRSDPTKRLESTREWSMLVVREAEDCPVVGPCDEVVSCTRTSCALKPAPRGTSCGPARCTQELFTAASVCDGQSVCVTGAQSVCGRFACTTDGAACEHDCQHDKQCAPGLFCRAGACLTAEEATVRVEKISEQLPASGCACDTGAGAFLAPLAAQLLGRRRRPAK